MSLDDHAPSVGILANPAAGRDIRRLVAQASVFPIAEKRNMITRLFSALGMLGVAKVYMMSDGNGIADRIRHALETPPPAGQFSPLGLLQSWQENTQLDHSYTNSGKRLLGRKWSVSPRLISSQ